MTELTGRTNCLYDSFHVIVHVYETALGIRGGNLMPDYFAVREKQIQGLYASQVSKFLSGYDPAKKTVILVPGIAGSELMRSKKKFDGLNGFDFDLQNYGRVWLGITESTDAPTLELGDDFHDQDDHIIVPHGAIEFEVLHLFKEVPYDAAVAYFKSQGHNCVVFGYDWRRALTETAQWLAWFVREIRDRLTSDSKPDPLPQMSLVCHSMGGLVAKRFLDDVYAGRASGIASWPGKYITAGTPFYGAAYFLPAFYNGMEDLNDTVYPDRLPTNLASWPAAYTLMFMPLSVFNNIKAKLGLTKYPVTNYANHTEEIDLYDVVARRRYPPWVRGDLLDEAGNILSQLAQPIAEDMNSRVYHLRSGLTQTVDRIVWADIDGSKFDPQPGQGDQSPLWTKTGKGDGTVPFWSAALVDTPASQIIELKKAAIHGALLEHPETLEDIERLL